MGILDETRFVERLHFFDGQRLFASDLQGIEAFHREMRWLHNRSLHQPGIGNGYAVSGRRDDREVRVGPGYATDALGREIVLTRDKVEPIPPVAAETGGESVFFDLVVSYPDDALLEAAETRQGICLPRGVVRLREEPVLCWVRLKRDAEDNLQPLDPRLGREILDGLRIALARIEVVDCKLRQAVSLAVRRSARPARLPFLACGEAAVPNDPAHFSKPDPARNNLHLLHMVIDTSAAGFQSTPCYSVRLARERVVREGDDLLFYILDSSPQILEPGAQSFTVEALFEVFEQISRGIPDPEPPDPLDGWTAVWMGVE